VPVVRIVKLLVVGTKRALSYVRARLIPEIWGASVALRCFIKANELRRKTQRNQEAAPLALPRGHREKLKPIAIPLALGLTESATRFPTSRS